jgi:hypothetical protein
MQLLWHCKGGTAKISDIYHRVHYELTFDRITTATARCRVIEDETRWTFSAHMTVIPTRVVIRPIKAPRRENTTVGSLQPPVRPHPTALLAHAQTDVDTQNKRFTSTPPPSAAAMRPGANVWLRRLPSAACPATCTLSRPHLDLSEKKASLFLAICTHFVPSRNASNARNRSFFPFHGRAQGLLRRRSLCYCTPIEPRPQVGCFRRLRANIYSWSAMYLYGSHRFINS